MAEEVATKICTKCSGLKTLDCFPIQTKSRKKDGLSSWCKNCHKLASPAYWAKNKEIRHQGQYDYYHNRGGRDKALLRQLSRKLEFFGLAREDYDFLIAQGCAICGAKSGEQKKALHLDHDHATGKFRGILCTKCNTALGLLDDDQERILALIDYLKT